LNYINTLTNIRYSSWYI